MNDESKRHQAPPADTPETPQEPAKGHESGSASVDEQAALAAAVEELRDKYLRAVAEAENLRRRAEREVADARAYGIASFARDVINVADNLTRALEAIEPEARDTAAGTLKALLDGVELTNRELQTVLGKHGIRPLDPQGEKFDPHFHQAMYEVPDADAPAGTVVQVMQTGYAIGERVLRPALVGVAKGNGKRNGKPAPQEQAPASGEGSENSD